MSNPWAVWGIAELLEELTGLAREGAPENDPHVRAITAEIIRRVRARPSA